MEGSIGAKGREVSANLAEKGGEFRPVHLAGGHWEREMMDRPEAARVAIDFDVVRRVGEHCGGAFCAHQRGERLGLERVTAQHAMPPKQP
jgi:hypothetical protein